MGRCDLDQRVRGGSCDPQSRAVVVAAATVAAAGRWPTAPNRTPGRARRPMAAGAQDPRPGACSRRARRAVGNRRGSPGPSLNRYRPSSRRPGGLRRWPGRAPQQGPRVAAAARRTGVGHLQWPRCALAGREPAVCIPPAVRGVVPAARSGHDPRRGPHGPRPGSATRMAFGRRGDLDLSRAAGAAAAASLLRRAAPDRCCTPTRAAASHLGACQCRACRTDSCAGHRPGLLIIRCNGAADLTEPY